jgi:hypothetical protein
MIKIDLSKLGITGGLWLNKPHLITNRNDVICLFSGHPRIRTSERLSNAKLIAAAPEIAKNEILNSIDAGKAMQDLEKDIPDMSYVYQILMSIKSRSIEGTNKAFDLPWPEVKTRLGVSDEN